MTNIDRLIGLRNEIPPEVQIVAVSKFKATSEIQNLHEGAGQRIFGENRAQELATKAAQLPKSIEWHFIGHLQSNKVKTVVQVASMIQSVDSYRLLLEINKEASKAGKVQDCLLQIYIAKEESKFGFSEEELAQILNDNAFHNLQHIRIRGLMGMATFTDNWQLVASEFGFLRKQFEQLKNGIYSHCESFGILSMGMTDDYRIAIDEGSNMVRIGSGIFGAR